MIQMNQIKKYEQKLAIADKVIDSNKKLRDEIPLNIRNFIKQNKDKNYKFNYNIDDKNNKELIREIKMIIMLIYYSLV